VIASKRLRIIIVCEVLDNFGDAGISWRLACQLADEWHADITIAIDQASLLSLWRDKREARALPGITIIELPDLVPDDARPDLVIAMLGASIPPALRHYILRHDVRWIRYEYLTAEGWIEDFHLRSSVKPDDGAIEWFYYPGYTPDSGGLLRERCLLKELEPFTANTPDSIEHKQQWLRQHELHSPEGYFRVCLFGYPEPATRRFVDVLLDQRRPVCLFISESLAKSLALDTTDSRLRIHPWLDQPEFDRLLASCDLNIVRGEDSWLRAQWTGQPMLWQPYRQSGAGHLKKLEGFLDRLLIETDTAAAGAIRQTMLALNTDDDPAPALAVWFEHLDQIRSIHRDWQRRLAAQNSLSDRLLDFCRDHLQLAV